MSNAGQHVLAPAGEKVWIPEEIRQVVREALPAAAARSDGIEAEQTFVELLVTGLHRRGAVLVPLAFAKSTQAVDMNVYTMALSAKYEADRQLHTVRMLVDRSPERDTLFGEFQAVVDQLTGHAPPLDVLPCLAALEDRLRHLRRAVLGTPLDEPLEGPMTAIEEQQGAAS